MTQSAPRISKLPFLVGDILLIAAAVYVALYGSFLGQWQYVAIISALSFGAWLFAWPFVLEFRAATKLAQSASLHEVTAKIKDLDGVCSSIKSAILEWQHLQQSSTQTVTAAQHIAEQMTTEARSFGELMSRLHDNEKNNLRLEVEKLRRSEGDWLGVTVRMLDHVHALFQAGVRSGQKNLIEQLGSFQNACRESARRLGVVPVIPETNVPFNPEAHQLLENAKAPSGAIISDIVAPGYTFQGQIIRLPVVALKEAKAEKPKPVDPTPMLFDEPAS